jgi:hypothetical protein
MKTTSRLLRLVATFIALPAALFAAASSASSSGTTSSRHELRVLKTYAAKDGNHLFRAYVVEWNGQEVIAQDSLVRKKYHTDDTITVLVMKSPYPRGGAAHGLLKFIVVPSKNDRTAPPPDPDALPSGASHLPPARHDLRVRKTYFANDGEFIFRAYAVEWQGEEVIVYDSLVQSRHNAGETVHTLVMKHAHPDPTQPHGLLNFTYIRPPIVTPRRSLFGR